MQEKATSGSENGASSRKWIKGRKKGTGEETRKSEDGREAKKNNSKEGVDQPNVLWRTEGLRG